MAQSKKSQKEVPSIYYEIDEQNFGIDFPLGIQAEDLLKILKNAQQKN